MRIVILTAALLASALALASPPRGGPAPIEHLTEELALDANQVVQVEQILNSKRERMKELRELEDADRRAEMKQVHEDTRLQLQGVLSDTQMQKLDELHQQRMEKHGKRHGKGDRDQRGADDESA